MKNTEYDHQELEYAKNTLIQCLQVNKAIIEGRLGEHLMTKSFLEDNNRRLDKCILILATVQESITENYEG